MAIRLCNSDEETLSHPGGLRKQKLGPSDAQLPAHKDAEQGDLWFVIRVGHAYYSISGRWESGCLQGRTQLNSFS